MAWGELALAAAARAIIPAATRLWNSLARRKLLAIRLAPFDDPKMLRAFDLSLTNVSGESLRLNSIFIRSPAGSEFAIRWHIPIIILDGSGGLDHEPWERQHRYPLDHVLDSGETYNCEIGIPQGFAISASRKEPVTIAVEITTFGEREQTIVQDIKRRIVA
jgi:hypothetical protein